MSIAYVEELLWGDLEVVAQGVLRPLEEEAMKLADQWPQCFSTQTDDFGLKDLVAEHGNSLCSNTATKAHFLTRRYLEDKIGANQSRICRGCALMGV